MCPGNFSLGSWDAVLVLKKTGNFSLGSWDPVSVLKKTGNFRKLRPCVSVKENW